MKFFLGKVRCPTKFSKTIGNITLGKVGCPTEFSKTTGNINPGEVRCPTEFSKAGGLAACLNRRAAGLELKCKISSACQPGWAELS